MANTLQSLQKHYLRIIRTWPTEHLRSVNVQDSLRRRMTQRLLPSTQVPSAQTSEALAPSPPPIVGNWMDAKVEAAGAEPTKQGVVSKGMTGEEKEWRQVNAMYSLLENRYSQTYPTSERIMRPEFKPSYYEDLAAEMEAAPKRTWFQNKLNNWSRLIRFNT